jgi:hypothetical protein
VGSPYLKEVEMNIGKLNIGNDGAVTFDGSSIGRITKLFIEQDAYGRSGSVSIFPVDSSIDMLEIARDLATSNLCVTFDFSQSFWPNSFVRDGEWHIEIPSSTGGDTQIISLGVARAAPSGLDLLDVEDLMISGY